jgi:hypothetical protein
MMSSLSTRFIPLFVFCICLYSLIVLIHSGSHEKSYEDPLHLPLRHAQHPNVFLFEGDRALRSDNCSTSLFFVGQQKSGTQTMMKILNTIQVHNRNSFHTRDNMKKIRRDGECVCRERGYLEISDEMPWCSRCTPSFFTIFRDPLDRVRSAYHYCIRVQGNDPLCAYNQPITDICTFAKMWGNYQFDKFLTVPSTTSPRKLHAYASKWCPDCEIFRREDHRTEQASAGGMYLSQVYANKLMLAHYGLNDLSTKQGKLHFSRVVQSLKTSFAAIGLLERWNETMAIFHEYTGCKAFLFANDFQQNSADTLKRSQTSNMGPGATPKRKPRSPLVYRNGPITSSSTRSGNNHHHSFPSKSADEVNYDWERCLPDLVGKYLAADIQIYNVAKDIFEAQLLSVNKTTRNNY